jgi:O-antigen/teichoic acid export membrane protein
VAVASDIVEQGTAETIGAAGLREKVLSGLAWKIVSQIFAQGSRFAVSLLLARLLTPHQFGLAAMAIAFSGLAMIFSDPALTAAIVRRKTITEEDRSTVFWTTLAAGAACTALMIALSGLIAAFFSEPSIKPLVIVEAFSFVLVALSATQVALMTREMNFRGLELRDTAGTLGGAAVAVGLAFGGFGAWAIIGQSIASVTIATALLWRFSTWRPRLLFSMRSLRECGSFGSKMLGARLLSYLNINADNLMVGRALGSAALGVYAIAYNVMFAPLARLAAPVQAVMIPAFARLQDDLPRLGQAWTRGARLTAAISMPGFLGMVAVAPDFVPVVLGGRWNAAVPVLQLLCVAGFFQSVEALQWSVLQSCGRAGTLLRYTFVSTTINLAAFAIGLHWGIVGVAAGFAIARALVVPFVTRITCGVVGLRVREYLAAYWTVGQGSAAMLACVLAARALLVEVGAPAAARLPVLVAIGVAVYAGFLFLRANDVMTELRELRRRA